MERVEHPSNGARLPVEVLRSLIALRANKDSMKRKDYKAAHQALWMQAELSVEHHDRRQIAKAEPAMPEPGHSGYDAEAVVRSLQRYAAGTGGESIERHACEVPFEEALMHGAAAIQALARVRQAID